jgi:hypothetical protein
VLDAYRLAVTERYRFFSYGDAMLLWRAIDRASSDAPTAEAWRTG